MTHRQKKWLWAGVRVVVCAAALWYAVRQVTLRDHAVLTDGRTIRLIELGEETIRFDLPDGQVESLPRSAIRRDKEGLEEIDYGLATVLAQSDRSVLLLAWLIFMPVFAFQALRFVCMLRAQEIALTYWESAKLTIVGNFLNFVTPGSTGGDLAKAYGVSLHTDRKTEAVTTVVLDRVVGLTGLVATVGLMLILDWGRWTVSWIGYLVLGVLLAIIVGFGLFLSPAVRRWVRLERWAPKLPFADQIIRIDEATRRLVHHKPMVLSALLLTLMLQLCALSSFSTVARALHMRWDERPLMRYITYLGAGEVVKAVPITPQGVGTTEAFYTYALRDFGTVSQILCLAMAVRLIGLSWALPGALVMLTGSYRPARST